MLATPPLNDYLEKSVIMAQLTKGAEGNAAIRAVRNLKQLAGETSTDVEGVVAWLQSSYNPAEAWRKLLE